MSYEDHDTLGAEAVAFNATMTAHSALAAAGVLSNPITHDSPPDFVRVQIRRIVPLLSASLADFKQALATLEGKQ